MQLLRTKLSICLSHLLDTTSDGNKITHTAKNVPIVEVLGSIVAIALDRTTLGRL